MSSTRARAASDATLVRRGSRRALFLSAGQVRPDLQIMRCKSRRRQDSRYRPPRKSVVLTEPQHQGGFSGEEGKEGESQAGKESEEGQKDREEGRQQAGGELAVRRDRALREPADIQTKSHHQRRLRHSAVVVFRCFCGRTSCGKTRQPRRRTDYSRRPDMIERIDVRTIRANDEKIRDAAPRLSSHHLPQSRAGVGMPANGVMNAIGQCFGQHGAAFHGTAIRSRSRVIEP